MLARALAAACLTGGLTGLSVSTAHASDDYPWAWQGQCPIVPQEPIVEPTPPPTPSPSPTPTKPGEPAAPVETPPPPPPPPPPVFDPVTGHTYDPRGPRPTCASRVWSINGSIGDSWGFVLRNCTSFVAWRLHQRNGLSGFANEFRGEHWGDAENWDDVARRLGYRVDRVPAIGAVAQSDDGRVGHVAWVSAIGPGTVTIEEYNHATPGGYGTRTVPVGDFRYLHLDDVAPSPLLGSDRPIVSVPDGLGESSTARVDDRGTLWLSRPGRPLRVAGPRRVFSPLAAPALALDRSGMPWLGATTRDGRVLVGRLREGRLHLRDVGASATTASPALTVTRRLAPVVAAVTARGTLTTRRLVHGRWSRPERVGRPGSWATHTAPVLGADHTGRTWLVAMTRGGSTYARPLESGRLARLPGGPGSVTSTPALTATGSGSTFLHRVDARGRLLALRLSGSTWRRAGVVPGAWSTYASPAVGEVAGRLLVAAVRTDGSLAVSAAVPGVGSRQGHRTMPGTDPTRSPGLVTRHHAGLFVVADRGRTATARLLSRPAWAVVVRTSPTRAGFTP